MNNILLKLIRKFMGLILLVVLFNFIEGRYDGEFVNMANDIRKESSKVSTSNVTKADNNSKNLLGGSSSELAGGKVIIKIISANAKDNSITIKAEIENNSDYVIKKSLYNFHLVDSTRKRMQLKPIDNNSFGGDITPNSTQTFHLVFTNVDLSAKPMMLKGELFIPDPRVRDDRFSLEVNY